MARKCGSSPKEKWEVESLHRLLKYKQSLLEGQFSTDQLVDSTAWHQLLYFVDAYQKVRSDPMYEPDQEATTIIMDEGYHY